MAVIEYGEDKARKAASGECPMCGSKRIEMGLSLGRTTSRGFRCKDCGLDADIRYEPTSILVFGMEEADDA
jgi:predicted RNA-binding Zn-ribbon protein involved in translation (DUF1610 family)